MVMRHVYVMLPSGKIFLRAGHCRRYVFDFAGFFLESSSDLHLNLSERT